MNYLLDETAPLAITLPRIVSDHLQSAERTGYFQVVRKVQLPVLVFTHL